VKLLDDYSGGRLLRSLFWAAALFAFVMAVIPHPPEPGHINDKIQHAVAFGVLGFLGSFAYPRWAATGLIIGLSVFGAFIEVAQAIPFIHRDSDPLDWLTDTIAVAAVVLIIDSWNSHKR
jgi:hypothetical protein